MEVKIRKFKKADIEQIRPLAYRAFDNPVDQYWSVKGALRAPHTLVAELDGKIVGVIEFEAYPLKNTREGHVWYIFVDPDYQRRGIGTKLLLTAEKQMIEEGASRSWALTGPENIKTKNFFIKNGYSVLTIQEMKKILGNDGAFKLLKRMIYYKGDVILMKPLVKQSSPPQQQE